MILELIGLKFGPYNLILPIEEKQKQHGLVISGT